MLLYASKVIQDLPINPTYVVMSGWGSGCGYREYTKRPTNKEAGRSLGKSPSPLAIAGLAPYAIKRATISFSLRPAAICNGVLPR